VENSGYQTQHEVKTIELAECKPLYNTHVKQ